MKVTLNNRKISFRLLFITASNKKLSTTGYFGCHSQKREKFLQSLSCPDLKYPDSFPDSYLSGFVCNPKIFCTGFVTSVQTATLNPNEKSPDHLRIQRIWSSVNVTQIRLEEELKFFIWGTKHEKMMETQRHSLKVFVIFRCLESLDQILKF